MRNELQEFKDLFEQINWEWSTDWILHIKEELKDYKWQAKYWHEQFVRINDAYNQVTQNVNLDSDDDVVGAPI